jgi:hypothetical protein
MTLPPRFDYLSSSSRSVFSRWSTFFPILRCGDGMYSSFVCYFIALLRIVPSLAHIFCSRILPSSIAESSRCVSPLAL